MDKYDRNRGFSNSSEQPDHFNSSGRYSRGSGPPYHHPQQDNYVGGGGGGGRDSPHGYPSGFKSGGGGRGGGGRGGGRENHRPFESPPPFNSPPSGGVGGIGGGGGGGLRPAGDVIGGFRPAVGAGEAFGPMGAGGGRGFRPMGAGGDGGGFRPIGGFGGDNGRFPPVGGDDGRFPPMGGNGGVLPPMGGGRGDGGRFGFDNYQVPPPPLTGQKRGFSGNERSPGIEVAGFAKLFVGSVPRTATEDDIRTPFEKHGRVMEVALIKDKKTGQPQGCCFIKYASPEEADRAIAALHNQYTLPGGIGPVQVRYADGERERLGATEYKLFVGSLNRLATEKEVEEIFSQYGRVEDVYLMRDEMKQSRGCGFVKYTQREIAQAAINALNGTYIMRGCDQPLTVRFADPKRPRPGESRGGPSFDGPGSGLRFSAPGIRPLPDLHEQFRGPNPNSWPSPQNLGPPSLVGNQGFASQFRPRSGNMAVSSTPGPIGAIPGSKDGSVPGPTVSSAPMSQRNFNQPLPQNPSFGSKQSPAQRPLQSPQHLPLPVQLPPSNITSFSNFHSLPGSQMHTGQIQTSNVTGQAPYSQAPPSQPLAGQNGQHSIPQLHVQHNASSAHRIAPGITNQPQHPQQLQPLNHPPSELAQMLSQQKQTLQATFQSSQQTLNQLQQQLHQLQPANQNLATHQGQLASKQQSPWPGTSSKPVANTTSTQASGDFATTTTVSPANPGGTPAVGTCNWSEHTSPDGYKYYYNTVTGESKWEKPEELMLYEHQQQKPSNPHPQVQSQPSGPSMQQAPQMHVQLQGQQHTHIHNQAKPFQQATQSSYQQVPGFSAKQGTKEIGYAQTPAGTGSANDPARYQQAPQEWMWKNKH